MTRIRSPNFPAISLPEALERIQSLYDKHGTNAAPREVIAQILGFAGITGTSASIIGALRQFGLLSGRGENLQVSELALNALHAPHDSSDYASAVREAAFSPPLFKLVRDQYSSGSPPKAAFLYLVAKQGLSSRAAWRAFRSYSQTVGFVDEIPPGIHVTADLAESVKAGPVQIPPDGSGSAGPLRHTEGIARTGASLDMPKRNIEHASEFPHVERTVLTHGIVVELRFSQQPTREALAALADYVAFRSKRAKSEG